jgi:hypothetical protein
VDSYLNKLMKWDSSYYISNTPPQEFRPVSLGIGSKFLTMLK